MRLARRAVSVLTRPQIAYSIADTEGSRTSPEAIARSLHYTIWGTLTKRPHTFKKLPHIQHS